MALPSDNDYEKKVSDLHSTTLPLNIESRLVNSPSALAEKVSILEAGRNDRFIEFFKAFILTEILKTRPELPYDSIKIVYVWENPGEYFIIYSNGNEVCRAAFDEKIYQFIAEENSETLCNTSDSPFFVCDINWALSHAESAAEKLNSNTVNSDTHVSEAPAADKSTDEIGFCRKCGKRIPSDSEFCSYCGVPVVSANGVGVSSPKKTKVKKPKKEKAKKSKQPKQKTKPEKSHTAMSALCKSIITLICINLLAFGFVYFINEYVISTSPSNNTDKATTTTTRKLVPITVPNGEIISSSSHPCIVDFEVSVPYGNDYYIYMEGKNSGDTMSFYVRSGQTVNIKVPTGIYTIYYAYGDTWYGSRYLFGDDTVYCKCDDTFEFTTEYGWSLSLHSVYNGNLDTDTIDADDFPGQ